MTLGAENDSLIDIPTAPTENLTPLKKTVKPWHAPRKQWIRVYQWNAQIEKLIDEIQNESNSEPRHISYLSLPGTELLDVRMVLQMCNAKNVRLKFLGFNDPENEKPQDITTLNISESELKKQPNVHPASVVIKDRLEMLATETSTAQAALNQFGSLDVINLDLTNCVASHMPGGLQEDYYKAIHQLFEHQKRRRVDPFLFFLTTRVHQDQIHRGAFGLLLEVLGKNFELHTSFSEKMKSCFGVLASDITSAQDDVGFSSISKYLDKIFSMALSKWMLKLLLDGGSQWSIEMQESCSYTVRAGGEPDMFSFAFICRPAQRSSFDSTGLSSLVATKTASVAELELKFAEKLIDDVASVFDLDRLIFNNANLTAELVEMATELMRQANYDPDNFRLEAQKQLARVADWIRQKEAAASTQEA